MRATSNFTEFRKKDQFRINYPYYGLFGSAEINMLITNNEQVYQCTLLNGNKVLIKKQAQGKKWIDVELNRETPLSGIIGTAIEDFLKDAQSGS